MTKKAECDLIYTCEDRTQIYVAKGNLSKWDFRVGFLKEGMKGTPRFAKHLHIATEFYIKHAHNPELAKKFKEYLNGNNTTHRVSRCLPRISLTHQMIEFENLETMLAEFPGSHLDSWRMCKDKSLIHTNGLKYKLAKPNLDDISNLDLFFNYFERRFNRGKQKTFILY